MYLRAVLEWQPQLGEVWASCDVPVRLPCVAWWPMRNSQPMAWQQVAQDKTRWGCLASNSALWLAQSLAARRTIKACSFEMCLPSEAVVFHLWIG